MKSSYITETHNEIEKNYYYNIKNKEKKKIFLAVNVSVFQPFRSFIVIIINSNYMDSQFSDIRKEYKKGKLTRNTISENPFEQFARWLNDALHCGENEPTAMIVATVSPDGRPSTRTVLLKGVENGKLIFFTNYESRKGRQLTANPYISLSFVWHKLERQVHIEGKAERCTPQESDTYFSTRPYKSRIGARISPQSHVISSRMEIIRAFVKEAARLTGQTVPRPDNWGGFAVTPTRFEFWQGRESRLHDRFQYTLHEAKPASGLSCPGFGKWEINRLAP